VRATHRETVRRGAIAEMMQEVLEAIFRLNRLRYSIFGGA
jgi:hypothetical protein